MWTLLTFCADYNYAHYPPKRWNLLLRKFSAKAQWDPRASSCKAFFGRANDVYSLIPTIYMELSYVHISVSPIKNDSVY